MNTDPQKVNHLAFIETPHIDYPPERRKVIWQSSVKGENICNEPYWWKLAEHFTAAEREKQQQEISAAKVALETSMKANRLKLSGWQVDAFLFKNEIAPSDSAPPAILCQELSTRHGKPVADISAAIANVKKAFDACQALRIPFQSVVADELPAESKLLKAAQEAVDKFRQMAFGVPKVSGVAGVVSYFKKNEAQAGAQVVLSDGPWKCKKSREGIRIAGAVVELAGKHGNRLATFVRLTLKPRGRPNAKSKKTLRASLPKAPDGWNNSVKGEFTINKPYWERYNLTLSPEQLAAQEKDHKAAYMELAEAMRINKGMFSEEQIKAYELDKNSNPLITIAIAACATLQIPFQCLVTSYISWGMSPEVAAFHRMDMGLKKCSTRHELAEYFKGQETGAQAVYTEGAKNRVTAVSDAKQNGIVITLEGAYGNRVATFIRPDEKRKAKKLEWQKSGRDMNDDTFCFSNRVNDLKEGEAAVYIEGARKTLGRAVKKHLSPDSCSFAKTDDKKGWQVTLKKIPEKSE